MNTKESSPITKIWLVLDSSWGTSKLLARQLLDHENTVNCVLILYFWAYQIKIVHICTAISSVFLKSHRWTKPVSTNSFSASSNFNIQDIVASTFAKTWVEFLMVSDLNLRGLFDIKIPNDYNMSEINLIQRRISTTNCVSLCIILILRFWKRKVE